jgi:hypothetical protein
MRLAAICVVIFGLLIAPRAVQAKVYMMEISGYSDGSPMSGRRYLLVPEEGQHSANPFELAEYGRSVDRILAAHGMVPVSNARDADLLITMAYGISSPNVQTYQNPVTTTHIAPVQATTTVQAIAPNMAIATTNNNGGGQTITSGGDSYNVTTYRRFMRLVAVDVATLRETHTVREHWRLEAKSEGSSNDLREIFPILAFGARPYVGTDTGKALPIKVKEKDKDLQAFLASPSPAALSASTPAPAAPAPAVK